MSQPGALYAARNVLKAWLLVIAIGALLGALNLVALALLVYAVAVAFHQPAQHVDAGLVLGQVALDVRLEVVLGQQQLEPGVGERTWS